VLLRENPEAAAQILAEARERVDARSLRAPGVHVSDLIRCLRRSWYEKRGYVASDPGVDSIMLLGHGHHGVLQPPAGAEMHVTLAGEVPIHGTIDVYLPENKLWTHPTEIKSTRYSSEKPVIDGLGQYIEQLAAYCLIVGDPTGRLVIWHLMGNYSTSRAPKLRVWDIIFEEGELESWEPELRRRAAILIGDEEPSLDEHFEWECKDCPLRTVLGLCEGGEGRVTAWFYGLPEWVSG